MDALKHLPSLRRFKARLPNLKFALELDSLTNLQEVIMEETSQMYQEDIFESLARAVAQNPGLTSIDVSSSWRYHRVNHKFQSLHQLFKYYPTAAPPLRLRHLALKICLVRLDKITLPHLTHLTSLSLTLIEDPYVTRLPSSFSAHLQEDSAIMQERQRYGSRLDDIWKALIHAGVRLEAITVDAVPYPFLDYLASYSGLKALQLTPGGFHEGTSSDSVARQFFDITLKSHTQSLQDLQIVSLFEGLWCFGSHNVDVVSKCIRLRNLRMNIISYQLGPENEDQNPSTEEPDVMVSRLLSVMVLDF